MLMRYLRKTYFMKTNKLQGVKAQNIDLSFYPKLRIAKIPFSRTSLLPPNAIKNYSFYIMTMQLYICIYNYIYYSFRINIFAKYLLETTSLKK